MNVSICLIVKDENSYLQEWLDYHILLGVDHFWIYDNESITSIKDTLTEYIDSGWVTVHSIKGSGVQLHAYDHCIQTYGSISRWIGFIDTDEFIVLNQSDNLPKFLQKFESYAGLAVSSIFFGPGGNKIRPEMGQVAGYGLRTPERLSVNRFIKSIIQPGRVIYPISPHSFLYKEGEYCVNESGLRVDAQRFPCHISQIHVNHYYTRSEEEWFHKLTRGRGDTGNPYSDERWQRIQKYSTVRDSSAVNLMKKLLKGASKNVHRENLIQTMHRMVVKRKAPPCDLPPCEETVIPRKELVDYFTEISIGTNLLESGQLAQAQAFYADQIKKYPFDLVRYTNFAAVSIQMGDFKAAWPALAQAWRMAPQSLYVLLCMIEYFYNTGDYEQVEKICALAAAQGELESEVIAILAISQWKLGKQSEAIETSKSLMARVKEIEAKKPVIRELFELIPH